MKKSLSAAIATGILLAYAAPVFAADAAAPTTKKDCKKVADMKWDAKTKTCVKK
jgi:hypothetical protein